jgi:protein-S-isoprenylcysteine O-methyltransferase Ste14
VSSGTAQGDLKTVVRALLHVAAIGTILFLAAGSVAWWPAWAIVLVVGAYQGIVLVWSRRDFRIASLDEEQRMRAPKPGRLEMILAAIYPLLLLGVLITSGLDAGRFHWSAVPWTAQLAGLLAVVSAHAVFLWCMATSKASLWRTEARASAPILIQSGPYHFIRHPFNTATVLISLGGALLLGSWWAGIPAVLVFALMVFRTVLEEHTLQESMPGYREYAGSVRYRMFPGVW